jgi:AraC family transcriptional regulator of adaptative response / DNA-3-methyladenine glycosylase II
MKNDKLAEFGPGIRPGQTGPGSGFHVRIQRAGTARPVLDSGLMADSSTRRSMLDADVCGRALASRDPRFDGVFFVGIRTTMIYCRPVCPARVSYPERRRFFESAAAAERDGFRPCLRCRPELAPGRALVDAVPRVARAAAGRIAAGALNGRGVSQLAHELGVSDRHLRRALERELGVSPAELAQTHRLLLAKQLLADTSLPVTRIAFASGFQSLRRFNTVFRERYRMSPSALRQRRRAPTPAEVPAGASGDFVRLTLGYRAPMAWEALVATLAANATPGVDLVDRSRYCRSVELHGCRGVIFVEDASGHVTVDVSTSLLPVLMPLLARIRHLLDLNAEPAIIDAQLANGGLASQVARRPGLRMPGAFDGFEVAIRELLRRPGHASHLAERLSEVLGQPMETGIPTLNRLTPTADRVADAGAGFLTALGISERRSEAIVSVAAAVADGRLHLEPGSDVPTTLRALKQISGIGERAATAIVVRALHWPDAFDANDLSLQRSAGVTGSRALLRLAERWRPWRAYAAAHLWINS